MCIRDRPWPADGAAIVPTVASSPCPVLAKSTAGNPNLVPGMNQFVALQRRRTKQKTKNLLFFCSTFGFLSRSPRLLHRRDSARRRCRQAQEAPRRGAPETCASGGATAPARHLRHKQASWAPRPPAEPVDSRRCRHRTRREVRAARPRSCPLRRRRRRHHAGARRANRSSASGRCGRTRRRTLRWRRRSGATCRHGPTSGPSAMTSATAASTSPTARPCASLSEA